MSSDNDRSGMLIAAILSAGWQPEFARDGDRVILVLRQWRHPAVSRLMEPLEFAGADPVTVLEMAVVAVREQA